MFQSSGVLSHVLRARVDETNPLNAPNAFRCPAGAVSHTYHGPREAIRVNFLDAACTLGLWLLNALSVVASFEATKFAASLSSYDDAAGTRYVALSTVALIAWALSTSLLLAAFKRVFAGDFDRASLGGGA